MEKKISRYCTISISKELFAKIKKIADTDYRSVRQTSMMLLDKALIDYKKKSLKMQDPFKARGADELMKAEKITEEAAEKLYSKLRDKKEGDKMYKIEDILDWTPDYPGDIKSDQAFLIREIEGGYTIYNSDIDSIGGLGCSKMTSTNDRIIMDDRYVLREITM